MKKKIYSLIFMGLTVGFTSCLDENPSIDPDAVENVIEFYSTADVQVSSNEAVHPVFSDAYDIGTAEEHVIVVNYAGPRTAPEDIVVDIVVNNQAVAEYNDWNNLQADPDNVEPDHDLYDVLPESLYTIDNFQVVIPKGQRTANFVVKLNTSEFDFDKNYALGLTIVGASRGIVSANFSTAVFALQAKNRYDGTYELRFQHVIVNNDRAFDNGGVWDWGGDIEMRTVAGNEVALFDTWGFNDYLHPLRTTTGFSGTGQATPIFTFDTETNKIIGVRNYYPAPTNGRAYSLNPDYDSHWDPETQNIYASFIMTQPGFGPIIYTDTLFYVGPR